MGECSTKADFEGAQGFSKIDGFKCILTFCGDSFLKRQNLKFLFKILKFTAKKNFQLSKCFKSQSILAVNSNFLQKKF